MKTITGFLCFLPAFVFAQNGTLPNSGFENWSTQVLYEQPVDWTVIQDYGVINVSKSTDAASGNFSARMENSISPFQDTVLGALILGTVGEDIEGGIPYTSDFDELRGYYKYETSATDSVVAVVVKWNAGVETTVLHSMNGQVTTWTPFNLPVPAGPCDSIFIAFVSTNPFIWNVHPDTWLMVDSIHLGNSSGPAPAPLPNHDFENWSDVSIEEPDNWHTVNSLTIGNGFTTANKTTNAYSGSYAIELMTSQFTDGDTIPGYLSLGALTPYGWNFYHPAPYNAEPGEISGYYSATSSGSSDAFMLIEFMSGGTQIDFYIIPFMDNSGYAPFTQNISLPSQPDSVALFILSGSDPGSTLLLDDINFSGGNVGLQALMARLGIEVFPNPARDVLYIESNESMAGKELQILDLNGRVLRSEMIGSGGGRHEVNVAALPSGVYLYQIHYESELIRERFVVRH